MIRCEEDARFRLIGWEFGRRTVVARRMASLTMYYRRMLAGAYSFKLELNLSAFGTHSWVKLGYVGLKDSSS